ncbi:MAG: hypothetical protein HYZ29_05830 [Myxococcales bacterium]|nr:hypothetical protein [Myxococcales bacterium]
MRGRFIVVVGAVIGGVMACGGEDNAELFGSGGSGTGGATTGGSAGAGGSVSGGSGGAAGSSGGTTTGGSGGTTTGGSGGTTTGGSGGTTTGGSGGTTGGSGGTSGGSGGTTTGGTGGTATGGSGGSGGGCTVKKWCKDNDGDTYGNSYGMVSSCNKPSGGNWIEDGSKPRACEDCADSIKEAFPNSTHCSATGWYTTGGVSFDYNCDTQDNACSDFKKAAQCGPDPNDPGKCVGAGYLPALSGISPKNKYCGSTQWQDCLPTSVSLDGGTFFGCNPSVKTAPAIACK